MCVIVSCEQGPVGLDGAPGQPGAAGEKGQKGETGSGSPFQVLDRAELSSRGWSVPEDKVLVIKGEQGEPGIQGQPGTQGPAGLPGVGGIQVAHTVSLISLHMIHMLHSGSAGRGWADRTPGQTWSRREGGAAGPARSQGV